MELTADEVALLFSDWMKNETKMGVHLLPLEGKSVAFHLTGLVTHTATEIRVASANDQSGLSVSLDRRWVYFEAEQLPNRPDYLPTDVPFVGTILDDLGVIVFLALDAERYQGGVNHGSS